MKLLRLGLVALLSTLAVGTLNAQSFWKWRTKDGRIEVSDRAPPTDIPEANILQRPNAAPRPVPVATPVPNAEDDPSVAQAAPAPMSAASRADAELETKKRKLQADQAAQAQAKQRVEVERSAAQKADNCRRARSQQTALESGMRIARPNDKGEREFLDDKARADEVQRARQAIAANCN